jgi:asparagine synthase (glutamine-hydrolysing)
VSQVAGIVGGTAEARAAYRTSIASRVPLLSTQQTRTWRRGNAELIYAAARNAPVAAADCPSGAGAFVMGRWGTGADANAQDLLRACAKDTGHAVAHVEVYGLACYVEPSGTTWLGTDVLGLFPLYYHATRDTLVFSTSPALVAAHPNCKREFNVRGLVGNLLTMHMVGGQTLWKDVKRLAPGHALLWENGNGATEVPVCPLSPSDAHFGESYAQHLDRFDALLTGAVRRDAIEGSALLFSGGLDSRLLAAYLRKDLKGPPLPITLGKPTDLEMRIANRVARHLGWQQRGVDHDLSRYLDIADRHLTHQQLAVGFNDLAFWYAAEAAGESSTRAFTGVMGDTVIGGEHICWGYDPRRQTHTYDTLFAQINRYGFKPEQVRQLVRPDVLNCQLDATLADLRATYDACPGLPFQKTWLFDLYHRNRFHLAAIGWEVGCGAWPVLAFCDAAMIRAAANTPADSMTNRRVQNDLLLRHGADLAALPLDRNSRTDLAPLRYRSGWHRRWDQKVMSKYRRVLRKVHDRQGIERRYYFRVYDINNEAWRSVRRAAEPYRKLAEEIFDPQALRTFLPPPDARIQLKDGIIDAAKTKTLLGFLLWAGKHL